MCPMCHRNFDWRKPRLACYALSAWCIEDEDRLEKCPLVELPEKHGRLIDADAVIKKLAKAIPYIIDDDVTNAYVEGLGRAKIEIEDSVAVIEAEGEG